MYLKCTTYAPIIVKDVVNGFDPEQTCEKVKLCTSKCCLDLKLISELNSICINFGGFTVS